MANTSPAALPVAATAVVAPLAFLMWLVLAAKAYGDHFAKNKADMNIFFLFVMMLPSCVVLAAVTIAAQQWDAGFAFFTLTGVSTWAFKVFMCNCWERMKEAATTAKKG